MVEYLDLSQDCLTKPIRLDLATLESWMLWPDDDLGRQLWWRACVLEENSSRVDDLPEDLLRQFAKDALTIPRLEDLRKRALKRELHGALAGLVVLEAVVMKETLGVVRGAICDRLCGIIQVRPNTINNEIMPRFRSVAHLWGAYALRRDLNDGIFPCRISELRTFLATAEAIRVAGEKAKAPKANSTVLRAGEAVLLPDAIRTSLPSFELKTKVHDFPI